MTTTTETLFSPLNRQTAPQAAVPALDAVQSKFGFVPNLIGTLANAPEVLNSYLALDEQFAQSGFSPAERQIILLTVSVENECPYCVAAHSTILKNQLKVSAELVAQIRNGDPVTQSPENALVTLVREVVYQRGHVSEETVDQFLAAGYQKSQLLGLLVGVAMKTITNYMDHLSPVEIEEVFAAEK